VSQTRSGLATDKDTRAAIRYVIWQLDAKLRALYIEWRAECGSRDRAKYDAALRAMCPDNIHYKWFTKERFGFRFSFRGDHEFIIRVSETQIVWYRVH
jgi:hypothetical protein